MRQVFLGMLNCIETFFSFLSDKYHECKHYYSNVLWNSIRFCEIIINSRVLIFVEFVVQKIKFVHHVYLQYCDSTFIRWLQFSWFLQNALIHGFLNSCVQTLQATINENIVFRWIKQHLLQQLILTSAT